VTVDAAVIALAVAPRRLSAAIILGVAVLAMWTALKLLALSATARSAFAWLAVSLTSAPFLLC
jgi:hypothetical protein